MNHTPLYPNSHTLSPPQPYLELRGTLRFCEAYERRSQSRESACACCKFWQVAVCPSCTACTHNNGTATLRSTPSHRMHT